MTLRSERRQTLNLLGMVVAITALCAAAFTASSHPVAHAAGPLTDLGTLGDNTSQMNGINNNGTIVG